MNTPLLVFVCLFFFTSDILTMQLKTLFYNQRNTSHNLQLIKDLSHCCEPDQDVSVVGVTVSRNNSTHNRNADGQKNGQTVEQQTDNDRTAVLPQSLKLSSFRKGCFVQKT